MYSYQLDRGSSEVQQISYYHARVLQEWAYFTINSITGFVDRPKQKKKSLSSPLRIYEVPLRTNCTGIWQHALEPLGALRVQIRGPHVAIRLGDMMP